MYLGSLYGKQYGTTRSDCPFRVKKFILASMFCYLSCSTFYPLFYWAHSVNPNQCAEFTDRFFIFQFFTCTFYMQCLYILYVGVSFCLSIKFIILPYIFRQLVSSNVYSDQTSIGAILIRFYTVCYSRDFPMPKFGAAIYLASFPIENWLRTYQNHE